MIAAGAWHCLRSIFWHGALVASSIPAVIDMYRRAATDDLTARTVASFVGLDEVTP